LRWRLGFRQIAWDCNITNGSAAFAEDQRNARGRRENFIRVFYPAGVITALWEVVSVWRVIHAITIRERSVVGQRNIPSRIIPAWRKIDPSGRTGGGWCQG
jgi:hypothetical protein